METSYANGGQLSASNAEVWTHPATILKGLKWLVKKDAPLLLSLRPSWRKYSWLFEFMRAIPLYEKHTKETVRLALLARERLFEIVARESITFDHERRGILHFYKNGEAMAHARKVNGLLTDAGLERQELSPCEIREIEPALVGKFVGGFLTQGDSTGDIHMFTRRLAAVCESKGVVFRLGTDLRKILPKECSIGFSWAEQEPEASIEHSEFDAVIVCAGVGSAALASQLGDRLNVYPVKGYSITVPVVEGAGRDVAPWVSLLDDEAKIVTSRLGETRYRVAGTAEINGYNRDIRADRIRPLTRWVVQHHPKMDTSQCVPWAGLRPMMPDMMPRVMRGRHERVLYNTGHGHLGWTLSAATAEMVSELATDLLVQPAGTLR
jgi:D-amino-acid dehydrogenase